MNKIHPWLKVLLVVSLTLLLSAQPPQIGYSMEEPKITFDLSAPEVQVFKDTVVNTLLDSANTNRNLIMSNGIALKDGTVVIRQQALLIQEQNKLIDSLERVKNK